MQKLITVSVDTNQLIKDTDNPFSVSEVDSINEWLELGWEIEEWDFLKEDAGDGNILLLVILNDNAVFGEEQEFEEEFGFDEDLNGEQDEIDKEKKDRHF